MRYKQRQLKFLCSTLYCPWLMPLFANESFSIDNQLQKFSYAEGEKNDAGKVYRLLTLFKELNYSDKDALIYWKATYMAQKAAKLQYKKSPTKIRRDNKTTINFGTGNTNRNSIRYPKKVRKTAWKRFYKLFPKLK